LNLLGTSFLTNSVTECRAAICEGKAKLNNDERSSTVPHTYFENPEIHSPTWLQVRDSTWKEGTTAWSSTICTKVEQNSRYLSTPSSCRLLPPYHSFRPLSCPSVLQFNLPWADSQRLSSWKQQETSLNEWRGQRKPASNEALLWAMRPLLPK